MYSVFNKYGITWGRLNLIANRGTHMHKILIKQTLTDIHSSFAF